VVRAFLESRTPTDQAAARRGVTMRDTTTALPQPHEVPPADAAEGRLRGSSYLALRNVSCECKGGVLTLRGRLPSYHLKQVAEALVLGVEGVRRVENLIEVVASAPRHA
jgi:osmotically-inducible protein OsmY